MAQQAGKSGGINASDEVRALAHELNVDLTIVTPGGAADEITAADVRRVHRILAEIGPLEPLSPARRSMATAMTLARNEAQHACITDDAVLASPHADLSLRLIRAIATAVKAEPALNAWFDSRELGRRVLAKIHLGIEVDTPAGQYVCVLQDIAQRSEDSLRKGLDKMKADTARNLVPAEELRGYTITLANLGICGGRYAALPVVPPTVAVVAAGRVREQAVARDGKLLAALVLPLSLSFDHRAVSGGEAARFLAALVRDLELPA